MAIVDVMTWEVVCDIPGRVAAFHPNRELLANAGGDGVVALVDPSTCTVADEIVGVPKRSHPSDLPVPLDLDFIGGGEILMVTGSKVGQIQLWDLRAGNE